MVDRIGRWFTLGGRLRWYREEGTYVIYKYIRVREHGYKKMHADWHDHDISSRFAVYAGAVIPNLDEGSKTLIGRREQSSSRGFLITILLFTETAEKNEKCINKSMPRTARHTR